MEDIERQVAHSTNSSQHPNGVDRVVLSSLSQLPTDPRKRPRPQPVAQQSPNTPNAPFFRNAQVVLVLFICLHLIVCEF
jgi:hypothetical protein